MPTSSPQNKKKKKSKFTWAKLKLAQRGAYWAGLVLGTGTDWLAGTAAKNSWHFEGQVMPRKLG